MDYRSNDSLIILGDLQRTSVFERAILREQNDAERKRLVDYAAGVHPRLVILLGDSVFDGGSRREWMAFDRLTQPFHSQHVPVLSVAGNHEYWGFGHGDLSQFFLRFPALAGQTHRLQRFGPLGLILLDSNRAKMGEPAWNAQLSWMTRTLEGLDRDVSIRGVLLFAHHSPFTNSRVTHDNWDVAQVIVPLYLESRKTMAFFSGHVHAYERFQRQGKAFVVGGSAGGPRHRLAQGGDRPHPDDLFAGGALRDFALFQLILLESGVQVRVLGLPKGGIQVRAVDEFNLPWPE